MTKRSAGLPQPNSNLGVGRRRSPRVPAELACQVIWNHQSVSGSLIDLSMGGAAVGLADALPLEDGAQVRLQLNEDGSMLVNASLVTQAEEAFGTFVARLEFVSKGGSPELEALVAHCVETFRDTQAVVFRKHL